MMDLLSALNFLAKFPQAKEAIINLARVGEKNPALVQEVIRLIRIQTAMRDHE
jgi:hypothetical protein